MKKNVIDEKNVEVVDGKVVISSKELVDAIQCGEVSIDSEDEAGWNIICLEKSRA